MYTAHQPIQTGQGKPQKRYRTTESTAPPPPLKKTKLHAERVDLDGDTPNFDGLEPDLHALYKQRWGAIRTHHVINQPIQDRFNYSIDPETQTQPSDDTLHNDIFVPQTTSFKINYSYGFVLRNTETQELRYFHASYNNARVLDSAMTVTSVNEFDQFLERVEQTDLLEYARLQRENSKWFVLNVSNVSFYVTKIRKFNMH